MSGEAVSERTGSASLWHRLCYTPLRDLLRGRLSGRLDFELTLGAAELPASLTDLVRTTVRRTRLWGLEKVEVARELAAHFQDGLEAGATTDELARSFGDPRQAARLIRRAKRRSRPAAWKGLQLLTRTLLATIVVVLLMYVGLMVRLYMGEPTLSRNYLAELNAPVLAIPEDERAWPLYRQAYLATSEWPEHKDLSPTAANWPELAAFAEQNAEALRLYRAAAQKPHFGCVHGITGDLELACRHGKEPPGPDLVSAPSDEENPPFISVLLPELGPLREAARLLTIDAHVAALAGDGDRAFENAEAILRIGEHASQTPMLISDLVAIAILRLDIDLIGTLLRDQPDLFSDQQLVELSHGLAAVRGGGQLRVRFVAERWSFDDIVQRLYTDDGHGGGHLAADSSDLLASLSGADQSPLNEMLRGVGEVLVKSAVSAVIADRAEMRAKYRELMDAWETDGQLPLWKLKESRVDLEIVRMKESAIERLRYLPIVIMMPSLSRALVITELATQERDATLAALACELYRRRTGNWPPSLADLSPRYLPAVPVDRFDGQPLRYRLINGHPVIYSIGMDLDDDGGRLPEGKDRERANRKAREWFPPKSIAAMKASDSPELVDGDWVLWPPVD
jgi:hypothetical protein